jgi:hypothetical protein
MATRSSKLKSFAELAIANDTSNFLTNGRTPNVNPSNAKRWQRTSELRLSD